VATPLLSKIMVCILLLGADRVALTGSPAKAD
jgi:hypothetical protein